MSRSTHRSPAARRRTFVVSSGTRSWTACAAGFVLSGLAHAQEPVEAAPALNLPAVSISAPKPAYRDLDETLAQLETWHAARPETTRLLELGQSAGGRRIVALEIFAPGSVAPEARPTLLFVGGLDGISLHGSEEVLGIAAGLAAETAELSPDFTFVCLPWASPDGLAAEQLAIRGTGIGTQGRDATPVDDDLDGQSGEDAADDVDGDGVVTMMLVEEDEGAWRRAPDARFLLPFDHALASGPRYGLYREGRDDDGDGAFNEDGPGGVRADRNFTTGWLGPFADVSPGTLPMSAGPTQALATFVAARTLAGAWFFDGHSGRPEVTALNPLDPLAAQPALVELSFGLFKDALDAPPDVLTPLAHTPRGSAVDWLGARGHAILRVPFWGPEIGLGRSVVRPASLRGDEFVAPPELLEDFCSPDHGGARGGAWRRYLDDRRGGIGFVDWHPVELAAGKRVLVGGWEAAVLHNPPEEQLERSVIMAMNFAHGLLEALPKPAIEIGAVTRDGELCTVTAKVVRANPREGANLNIDFLAPSGLELALQLPPGARLIAGPEQLAIDDANLGQEIEWVVYAPNDAMLEVVLRHGASEASVVTRREVRP